MLMLYFGQESKS